MKSQLFGELLIITCGCILIASAVVIFFNPNDLVPGGFTAIAIFFNRFFNWPIGSVLVLLNIPFLLWGSFKLGAALGPKTIFATVLSSLLIDVLKPFLPIVKDEPLLYTLFGGMLYGAGMSLVFHGGATTGGTEIPAKLLERFYGVRLGKSLLIMDCIVLSLAGYFFGIKQALYALISTLIMSKVIDTLDSGPMNGRTVFIVSQKIDEIRKAVASELDRSVTILPGEGGYSHKSIGVTMVVVYKRQVGPLKRLVKKIDHQAFMSILPSEEVIGEGFKAP